MKLYDILEPEKKEKNSCERIVGIDLGTTNSLVAIMEGDTPKIIGDIIQSKVLVENGTLKTAGKNDKNFVGSFKRLMGKTLPQTSKEDNIIHKLQEGKNGLEIICGNDIILPIDASSCILSSLFEIVKNYDKTISKAVITVPAYFDIRAREETLQAANNSSIDVIRILSEPTAASIAYNLDKIEKGIFVVYDFGGGTFDVSVLKIQQGVSRVIATKGDNNLGGDDLDLLFANSKNISKDEAKAIKEQGTMENEFREICTPLVQRTIDIMSSCIKDSDINTEQIDGIILVGGSSKLKLAKDLIIKQYPNVRIYSDHDPEKVVALGAAIHAHMLAAGEGNVLVDVLPISIGLEMLSGINEKIISRNTSIPCSIKHKFTTFQDGQTGMIFNILQGEREMAKDCRIIASMELKNIPPKKAGTVTVEVEFSVDQDGILKVSAQDVNTGNLISTEINPIFGVSKNKIEEMIDESYRFHSSDFIEKKIAENKLKFSSIMSKISEIFANYPEFITFEDKEEYENFKQVNIFELNVEELERLTDKIEYFSENLASKQLSYFLSKKLSGAKINEV